MCERGSVHERISLAIGARGMLAWCVAGQVVVKSCHQHGLSRRSAACFRLLFGTVRSLFGSGSVRFAPSSTRFGPVRAPKRMFRATGQLSETDPWILPNPRPRIKKIPARRPIKAYSICSVVDFRSVPFCVPYPTENRKPSLTPRSFPIHS